MRKSDIDNLKMTGSWMMRKSDIDNLTPAQIRDKYALPNKPTHVVDVTVPKGVKMETGTTNPVQGWGSGGAQQYQVVEQFNDPASFRAMFANPRKLP